MEKIEEINNRIAKIKDRSTNDIEKLVKVKQGLCKHENTFEGNMPNSQSVHFYIECKDCGKTLKHWEEPA